MRLENMMTCNFSTLTADDSLDKATGLLRSSQRDGLPVLNADGSLAGIFTKTNLYDALLKSVSLDNTVEEYYNRNVVKISKDLSYDEVIEAVRKIPVGTGVVVDSNDKVVGLFTKVELITSLFKEERMLNTRLNAMCQAMHNALILVDESGFINYINRSAGQLFSIDFEQVQGSELDKILPGLDMNRVLKSGLVEIGAKYVFKEKASIVNKTPLIDQGRVIGAIAIFQDITEIESVAAELGTVKSLNRTLQTVLDIGYDALVVVDDESRVIFVNRTFLDFMRLDEKAVMHRPIGEIIENSRMHSVIKTGIPELKDIQFIENKPYVVSRLPVIRDQKVIGAVGKISFRRVNELRELAERLENMNNRLTHFQEELKKERHRDQPFKFEDIITLNPVMLDLIRDARQAAQGLSTVLVSGESGVGKELMAQALHQDGPRSNRPFVKINCAAIPENLLESEFFGYAGGAFTGARQGGKEGMLDRANGGTLFLDEIGDMPLSLQGKLLRVLQDQAYERVGDTATVKVDIRFIAATNQDLEEKISRGAFRKDLYYRLNVIHIPIPPLRERVEDIKPLVYAFLAKYNKIFGMNVNDISSEALNALHSYNWPGNIRELENVIERALNFTVENTIKLDNLPPKLRKLDINASESQGEKYYGSGFSNSLVSNVQIYKTEREEKEKETIARALNQANGNKSEAARILGISRSWLYRKIDRLDLRGEWNE